MFCRLNYSTKVLFADLRPYGIRIQIFFKTRLEVSLGKIVIILSLIKTRLSKMRSRPFRRLLK